MRLYDVIRAGRVTRWHSNPDLAHIRETDAEHQWMVSVILLAIYPHRSPLDLLPLLIAGIVHDTGELIGDLPLDFKLRCPDVAAAHSDEEAKVRQELGTDYFLRPGEAAWLKLADRLSALVHVAHHRPDLLGQAKWIEDRCWVQDKARELGSFAPVMDLLLKLTGKSE
jgi:5'-deoxynucleotidase YfbR-like HD superfamily hydrolase